jgi:hypothetical protein
MRNFWTLIRSLLIIAVLARGAIPAGFMPSPEGGIMVCPGMAAMEHGPEHRTGHHDDMNHDGAGHSPCAFSAAFAFGYLDHPVFVATTMVLPRADAPLLNAQFTPHGFARKPFLSQGPPLSA